MALLSPLFFFLQSLTFNILSKLHRHRLALPRRRFVVIIYLVFVASLSLRRWQDGHVLGMRLVIQRVKSASVTVEGRVISTIGPGILALVGIHEHDNDDDLLFCCKRLLGVKLWENENGGQWRHGVKQKDYSVLLVSQFTLYGTVSNKKYQPDYKLAMKSTPAESLYSNFVTLVRKEYAPDKVHDGVFGAMMDVELINDGPVTLIIDSEPKPPSNPQQHQPYQQQQGHGGETIAAEARTGDSSIS